jgi:hypothetical protein
MRAWLFPLLTGTALWSYAGWSAHPRELWDVPAFWPVWGAAILATAILAATNGNARRTTALVFLPLLVVLTVSAILTGRGFGLLPLGLLAVLVLAQPAWGLSSLTRRLRRR